jgi:hypothetical protein
VLGGTSIAHLAIVPPGGLPHTVRLWLDPGIASPSPRRDPFIPMRLFRKSEEKIALEATTQAEIERLRKLSVEELAVMVLPGLGLEGVAPERNLRPQQLCEYLLRDFRGVGQTKPLQLMAPVRRALNKLEDAGLVSSMSYERSPLWRITSLGTSVLAEGTAEHHLSV